LKSRSPVICGNGEVDRVRNLSGHPMKCESRNETHDTTRSFQGDGDEIGVAKWFCIGESTETSFHPLQSCVVAEHIESPGVDTKLDRFSRAENAPIFLKGFHCTVYGALGDWLDGLGYVSPRLHTFSDRFIRFSKIGILQVAPEETTQLTSGNLPCSVWLIICLYRSALRFCCGPGSHPAASPLDGPHRDARL
jgi:hypothetical protein